MKLRKIRLTLILPEQPDGDMVFQGEVEMDLGPKSLVLRCDPEEASRLLDHYLRGPDPEEEDPGEAHHLPVEVDFENGSFETVEDVRSPEEQVVSGPPRRRAARTRTPAMDSQGNPVVEHAVNAQEFLGASNPNARGLDSL